MESRRMVKWVGGCEKGEGWQHNGYSQYFRCPAQILLSIRYFEVYVNTHLNLTYNCIFPLSKRPSFPFSE